MQRILTLDIDYIMSPSIHVYDDWIDGHWVNSATQWEMVVKKMGVEPTHCTRRADYLLKIFLRALEFLNDESQIKFARDHHSILEHIGEHKDLIIHNVDHHHDIFYKGWSDPSILNEGNWVWWLDKKEQIEEYTWFGNLNSERFDQSMPFYCEYNKVFDRRRRPMTNPDFIFVCESPHWVPPNSRSIFSTMQHLANNYFKEVHSEIERKKS